MKNVLTSPSKNMKRKYKKPIHQKKLACKFPNFEITFGKVLKQKIIYYIGTNPQRMLTLQCK